MWGLTSLTSSASDTIGRNRPVSPRSPDTAEQIITTPPTPPNQPSRRAYRAQLPPSFAKPPARFSWQAVAILLFAVNMTVCFIMWIHRITSVGAIGVGLFLIPILTLLTLPLFMRAARTKPFDLGGLMAVGLMLRFLASFYRFDHAQDGGVYTIKGGELAQSFRHLHFDVDTGGSFPGTGGMRFIAGIVATITNTSAFAEFLVFTWLGFIGCYLLYRAFVMAMPDADHRRYALLIFLWPTLVFWPSSAGKDCWMLFTLGIGAVGAARVLTRRPGGYTLLMIGLLLGSVVRPHIALIELVAFAFALLIGRRDFARGGALTPGAVAKVAGLIALLVLGAVLVNRTADLLASNDINTSVDSALATNSTRTAQGGSQFSPSNPRQPIGYAIAGVTVLFRPFPFEAHAIDQLGVSIETLGLAVLAALSWRRLVTIPRRLRSDPYVTMALIYMMMFVFALGTVSNFGILARERSQLMPFVFVLLSVPVVVRPKVEPVSGAGRVT